MHSIGWLCRKRDWQTLQEMAHQPQPSSLLNRYGMLQIAIAAASTAAQAVQCMQHSNPAGNCCMLCLYLRLSCGSHPPQTYLEVFGTCPHQFAVCAEGLVNNSHAHWLEHIFQISYGRYVKVTAPERVPVTHTCTTRSA